MSIKNSLRISIILVAIVPLIFMTLLTYKLSHDRYFQLAKDSASNLANTYAEGFESQIKTQIAEIEGLSNVTNVQNIVLENYNGVPMGTSSVYYESVKQLLDSTSKYTDNTVNYYIYDINGYYIASSSNEEATDWEEYMEIPVSDIKAVTIMKSSNINKDSQSIEIVSPIIVKSTIVGLIRVNISSDYFGAFIPSTGNAFILTDSGEYLFSSTGLSEYEGIEEQAMQYLKNRAGYGSIVTRKKSVEDIFGYSYINSYNWIYLIKQEGEQYKSIMSTFPFTLLISLTIFLLLALLLIQFLTSKYTRPIITLKNKMKEASNGNLDVSCDIHSNDEFGELSNSFNNMMNIIANSYDQLNTSKKLLESNEEELKKNYAHIEQLAYHDGLTGLLNRVAFMKYAYEIFHKDGSQLSKHAIYFLDLDNFKNVNDTLGHDYGDILLKQVSSKLTDVLGPNDILARTGGDEFLILKNSYSSLDELEAFAKTLVNIIKAPFDLDGETANISLSLGVSLFPKDGLTISELIKNADIAMYNAKNSGKNRFKFFNSYMEDDVNRKNDLADILMNVIERKEISLNYQPQINVKTGKISGYEALMRINSEFVGRISPAEFIPIAEDNGIINKLGDWALYEACTFNNNLIKSGLTPLKVSINVSTSQLRDNHLINVIKSIPEITGMPLEHLELEITESVLMHSLEHNLKQINMFKEMGASIALDDFGTGYSSFNYLTQIPIDTLKIDKSFVDGLCTNEKDRVIAESIIALAHNLDIAVVAEGVETLAQLNILTNQNCDTIQGYLFSKPLTSDELITFITDSENVPSNV